MSPFSDTRFIGVLLLAILNFWIVKSQECQADIVFIIDSSSSVGDDFDRQIDFVYQTAKLLNFETGAHRAALVEYAGDSKIVKTIPFNKYRSTESFLRMIENIRHFSGITLTKRALERVMTLLDTRRQDVPTLALIVTDGFATDDPSSIAEEMRAMPFVTVFAAGVNDIVKDEALLDLAGHPDRVFRDPNAQEKAEKAVGDFLNCRFSLVRGLGPTGDRVENLINNPDVRGSGGTDPKQGRNGSPPNNGDDKFGIPGRPGNSDRGNPNGRNQGIPSNRTPNGNISPDLGLNTDAGPGGKPTVDSGSPGRNNNNNRIPSNRNRGGSPGQSTNRNGSGGRGNSSRTTKAPKPSGRGSDRLPSPNRGRGGNTNGGSSRLLTRKPTVPKKNIDGSPSSGGARTGGAPSRNRNVDRNRGNPSGRTGPSGGTGSPAGGRNSGTPSSNRTVDRSRGNPGGRVGPSGRNGSPDGDETGGSPSRSVDRNRGNPSGRTGPSGNGRTSGGGRTGGSPSSNRSNPGGRNGPSGRSGSPDGGRTGGSPSRNRNIDRNRGNPSGPSGPSRGGGGSRVDKPTPGRENENSIPNRGRGRGTPKPRTGNSSGRFIRKPTPKPSRSRGDRGKTPSRGNSRGSGNSGRRNGGPSRNSNRRIPPKGGSLGKPPKSDKNRFPFGRPDSMSGGGGGRNEPAAKLPTRTSRTKPPKTGRSRGISNRRITPRPRTPRTRRPSRGNNRRNNGRTNNRNRTRQPKAPTTRKPRVRGFSRRIPPTVPSKDRNTPSSRNNRITPATRRITKAPKILGQPESIPGIQGGDFDRSRKSSQLIVLMDSEAENSLGFYMALELLSAIADAFSTVTRVASSVIDIAEPIPKMRDINSYIPTLKRKRSANTYSSSCISRGLKVASDIVPDLAGPSGSAPFRFKTAKNNSTGMAVVILSNQNECAGDLSAANNLVRNGVQVFSVSTTSSLRPSERKADISHLQTLTDDYRNIFSFCDGDIFIWNLKGKLVDNN